ncbi:MAG TPA: type II CAAX endopeptidase family protein [Halanaerobiales bacterium]|nr:type II CAAX endopeptidase family protein [Halanaerobiales bacterium]
MKKSKVKKELIMFVFITLGWSWLFWFAEIIWEINLYVAPFGPLVAALFLTYLKDDKKGLTQLFKKGINFHFNKIWYLPILLLMPLTAYLAVLIASSLGENVFNLNIVNDPLKIIGNFFYILMLGGPLQEEFGWRGYALPRLLKKYNALIASIILGVIWSIWHLPLNFISQAGLQYQAAVSYIMSSLVLMVFVSILFTWIFQNTGGSIFSVLIFHTTLNLSTYVIFPVFELRMGPPIFMALIFLITIVVLTIFGYKRLTFQKKKNLKL